MREGVGLEAKAGCHSEPHTRPDIKTLLKQYQRHELHSQHPGRSIDEEDVDNFQRGWEKLVKGKLRWWVMDSASSQHQTNGQQTTHEIDALGSDSGDENHKGAMDREDQVRPTFGSMHMVNGELVVQTRDFEETIQTFVSMLDAKHNQASDSAGSTGDEAGDESEV